MKIGRAIFALALCAAPLSVWAQSTPVYQSVLMTSPHDLAKITRNGQIQDAGGVLGDSSGRGVNPFAVQDNLGLGECSNSAVTSGQYYALCFGHDASGNGLVTLDSFGGLGTKALNFRINGTTYPFPGTGNGNVLGPNSTTVGDFAVWNNTGGTLLKDLPAAGLAPISFTSTPVGGVGDGVTSNASAFAYVFADTNKDTFYLPPGTYYLPCGNYYTAASAVSLIGAGPEKTTILLQTGCAFSNSNPLFTWNGKSGVRVENLTLDLNTPATPSSQTSAILVQAYSGNIVGPYIRNVRVINGTSPMFLISLGANNGFTMMQPIVENNYVSFATAASATGNEGIGLTTVNGAGRITGAIIEGNVLVNTGMQVDGDNSSVAFNDISAFAFGAGIYGADATAGQASCIKNSFIGNIIHDTTAGVDINSAAHMGIENHCPYTLIEGNVTYNLGGAGILNTGDFVSIIGNTGWDNGKNGSGGAGGIGDQAGISLANVPANFHSNGQGVLVSGNNFFDDRTTTLTTTQKYGLVIGSNVTASFPQRVTSDNVFTVAAADIIAGTGQAINVANPGSIAADWIYNNTQSNQASSVASESWFPLDTASYKHWQLDCDEVTPDSAQIMYLRVGEGSSPTWDAGAHYSVAYSGQENGAAVQGGSSTATGVFLGKTAFDDTQATPGQFTVNTGDLAYGTGIASKLFRFASAYFASGLGGGSIQGMGYWGNDTNPITGLQVVAASGSFKGTCTLRGRP